MLAALRTWAADWLLRSAVDLAVDSREMEARVPAAGGSMAGGDGQVLLLVGIVSRAKIRLAQLLVVRHDPPGPRPRHKLTPRIVRLWDNVWAEFVPFVNFDPEIRRAPRMKVGNPRSGCRQGRGSVRNFVGVVRRDLHGFGSWVGEDQA